MRSLKCPAGWTYKISYSAKPLSYYLLRKGQPRGGASESTASPHGLMGGSPAKGAGHSLGPTALQASGACAHTRRRRAQRLFCSKCWTSGTRILTTHPAPLRLARLGGLGKERSLEAGRSAPAPAADTDTMRAPGASPTGRSAVVAAVRASERCLGGAPLRNRAEGPVDPCGAGAGGAPLPRLPAPSPRRPPPLLLPWRSPCLPPRS